MFNSLNRSSFSLFFLGFTGVGYFGFKWYHDRKYQHPIVEEAVRLLQWNDQVLKLTGYPLSTKISLGSEAEVTDAVCRYRFKVTGPKGSANVELMGQSRELAEIEKSSKFDEFYIPATNIMLDLVKYENETPEQLAKIEVAPQTKYWKIDHLVADIGLQGDFRITLLDANQIFNKPVIYTPAVVTKRQNMQQVRQEVESRRPKVPQTEQEIEEARKYRQQEMYRKMGGIRMLVFGGTVLVGMAMYNYMSTHKRISVLNSQIHLQALEIVTRHPTIKQIFGTNVHFNTQLRGGQVGEVAEFEADLYGKKNGVVFVKGLKRSKQNDWIIENIEFGLKDEDGKVGERQKIFGK